MAKECKLTKRLSAKLQIPVVGLGTWQLTDKKELTDALDYAYDAGYRLIDTAHIYKNESIIGDWIKKKGNRDELFITTKLWNSDHNNVKKACEDSINKLCCGCIDLYLVHWPVNSTSEFNLEKLWSEMEDLVMCGMVREIGVANFGIKNLEKLLSFCRIRPVMNQIEMHAYFPQKELREYCKENNILVTSYSTLGSSGKGEILRNDSLIKELAKKYNRSESAILLAYAVAHGCCIIPRSRSKSHIEDNINVLELEKEDIKKIDKLGKNMRFVDPVDFGPGRFD